MKLTPWQQTVAALLAVKGQRAGGSAHQARRKPTAAMLKIAAAMQPGNEYTAQQLAAATSIPLPLLKNRLQRMRQRGMIQSVEAGPRFLYKLPPV